MYVSAWRAANVELHGSLSNGAAWQQGTPVAITALVLKGSYGLIWNRARAKMCNRSYRIAPGAPPEQSDVCFMCNAAADEVRPHPRRLPLPRHEGVLHLDAQQGRAQYPQGT